MRQESKNSQNNLFFRMVTLFHKSFYIEFRDVTPYLLCSNNMNEMISYSFDKDRMGIPQKGAES